MKKKRFYIKTHRYPPLYHRSQGCCISVADVVHKTEKCGTVPAAWLCVNPKAKFYINAYI